MHISRRTDIEDKVDEVCVLALLDREIIADRSTESDSPPVRDFKCPDCIASEELREPGLRGVPGKDPLAKHPNRGEVELSEVQYERD
ncbi:hypothetical protein A5707_16420 [Mycobacterium kyorinense]|uniref:Uncharacterized protein n=1 Tax=Mycobacterium kyorinense TaxID=487514 RepID=A0A1A2ZJD9_9MYCO|nr:hypothetical protein A5707_16420 [Mycobacterium kyorinense]